MKLRSRDGARERVLGWVLFSVFGILIAAGIYAKRVHDHADWVVFFHLPAAVFLVLGFRRLSQRVRQSHQMEMQELSVGGPKTPS